MGQNCRRGLVCVLSFCALVGCNTVGNRSLALLSPEEREMVLAYRQRQVKSRKNSVKPRPVSADRKSRHKEAGMLPIKIALPKKPRRAERRFRWSWDRGVVTPGKPSKDHPDYDEDGNLIVAPEVVRTYKIPEMHSGLLWDLDQNMVRAALEVELCEIRIPKARWLGVGVVGAEQFLGVHVSKCWTSVFEIETGLFAGWDFDENEVTWGLAGLIIKF